MRLNELPGSSDFLASTTQIVGTRVFFASMASLFSLTDSEAD